MMIPTQSNRIEMISQYDKISIQQSKGTNEAKRNRCRMKFKSKPKRQKIETHEIEIVDLEYEESRICSIRNPPKKNEDAKTIFK
jgi:hypothetical protein